MKTTTKTTRRFRPITVTASLLMPFIAASSLVSCASNSPDKPSVSSPIAFEPDDWYQVENDPPTYFPKEVKPDQPTNFFDGSWVYSGDEFDTRYFIPLNGVGSESLIADAMTTMTPERRKELRRGSSNEFVSASGVAGIFRNVVYGFVDLLFHMERAGANVRSQ